MMADKTDKTDQTITVFTDGACSGNPGPGGWGAIMRWNGHEKEISGAHPDTTNNRMEMMAVVRALEALKKPSNVEIYTDSQYVQKGVNEWMAGWKRRGWKTAGKKEVQNKGLWQEIDELVQKHVVRFHWIKGHAGHPENERADELAVNAMRALMAENDES
jgi:ribonuclease HI